MELFRVTSVIDKLSHDHHRYNGVKVHWFVIDRRFPVVSYKKVVAGFEDLPEKDKAFAREYVKELFTKKEAEQLSQHLKSLHGCEAEIIPLTLPTEGKCLGFRAHTVGKTTGFFKLKEEVVHNLPFKVWAYYDVDGLVPIGGFRSVITSIRENLANRLRSVVGVQTIEKKDSVV
jgi:hypothetical protein